MVIASSLLLAALAMVFQPADPPARPNPDPTAAPGNNNWSKAVRPAGFIPKRAEANGVSMPFTIYSPREYHPQSRQRRWPTIIFLHGSGECGTDGQKQLTIGLPAFIKKDPDRWPFLVIIPQKPDRAKQWEDYDAQIMAALEMAKAEYPVDPERIYLTGLSQGGHGVWALGAMHADLFAALVPICGYYRLNGQGPGFSPADLAQKVRELPIWVFHGEKDNAVPVSQAREMVAAIKATKPEREPKLTTYPDVSHDSWDRAYADPALPAWLLAQVKPTR